MLFQRNLLLIVNCMKKIVILLFCLKSWALFAYDFKALNEDGAILYYNILQGSDSVEFTYDISNYPLLNKDTLYKDINLDTLKIPDYVIYDNKEYRVTALGRRCLLNLNPTIKVLVIPSTISSIYIGKDRTSLRTTDANNASFIWTNLQKIIIDSNNYFYKSIDGVLYTSDMKTLVAYPPLSAEDSVILPDGVEYLAPYSMSNARNIKFLELPLSLKIMGGFCMEGIDNMRSLIVKDNVDTIAFAAIECLSLTRLTIGTGVKVVDNYFVDTDSVLSLYCRAVKPPFVRTGAGNFLNVVRTNGGVLYVPRKSINAYRQAEGWKLFGNIQPIDPPIITGIDTAEISWVQNFSATSYTWTLFLDENHTEKFLQLNFNDKGYLISIDFSKASPYKSKSDNTTLSDEENNRRYADYYSFTINGLSPDTEYYYTMQSFSGNVVIDEDSGSFRTQQTTEVNTTDIDKTDLSIRKQIQNNSLQILLPDGRRFDALGREIK